MSTIFDQIAARMAAMTSTDDSTSLDGSVAINQMKLEQRAATSGKSIPTTTLADPETVATVASFPTIQQNLTTTAKPKPSKTRPLDITPPKRSGDQNVWIDRNKFVYATDLSYFYTTDFSESNELPSYSIDDNFRFVTKKFWVQVENGVSFLKSDFSKDGHIPFTYEIDENPSFTQEVGYKFVRESIITLEPKPSEFIVPGRPSVPGAPPGFAIGRWKSYLEGEEIRGQMEGVGPTRATEVVAKWDRAVQLGQKFYDHAFFISIPKTGDGQSFEKYAKVRSEYNYFHEMFEGASSNRTVSENTMPNIYLNFAHVNNPDSVNIKVSRSNTLGGSMTNAFRTLNNNQSTSIVDYSQLLDEWALKINRIDPQVRQEILNYNSNIILTDDDLRQNLLEDIESSENMYPMAVTLEMYSDSVGPIKDLFNTAKITSKIIERVMSEDVQTRLNQNSPVATMPFVVTGTNAAPRDHDLRVYYFDEFLDHLTSQNQNINSFDASQFFIKLDAVSDAPGERLMQNLITASIVKTILMNKVATLVRTKTRTFVDILSGTPAYTDTVFYKIVKYKKGSNNPLQTIYIPSIDRNVIKYVDTQVKYSHSYEYRVFACNIVFGTEYSYEPLEGETGIQYGINNRATFKVVERPSVQIVEVPYFHFEEARVVDSPPLPPSVSFLPLLGDKSKIKICLETAYGEFKDIPQTILPIDLDITKEYLRDSDGKVMYDGDDKNTQYQVFKLDYQPRTPQDFGAASINVIDTSVPGRPKAKTRETSFYDFLPSNTKIYYAFRSTDVHGNISNLSDVYEAEIIDNDGAVYSIVTVVGYAKTKTKFKDKKFKKYLRIYASPNQEYIDVEKDKLGIGNHRLWGKKFKFRVTSKDTGRKIDLNIRFNYVKKVYEFSFDGNTSVVEAESVSDIFKLLLVEQNINLV